ncbi:hypothetical protein DdX_15929 [Ditylenchus destructor]|uniref:Uncharacterized protein n=1 Tax=Ditylenchus destructor TaxID=166010 RepID=A0AAD4R0G8_9BILA|nr:hypothetical protein DdX_15929 [Ditylenchus destructor]
MRAAGKQQETVAGDSRLLENFDKASMKPSFAFIEFPHHAYDKRGGSKPKTILLREIMDKEINGSGDTVEDPVEVTAEEPVLLRRPSRLPIWDTAEDPACVAPRKTAEASAEEATRVPPRTHCVR